MAPVSTQQHFELLKELPREILERILATYCDGKALSTLYLAVAADCRYYEKFRISDIARRLLLDIADAIEGASTGEPSHQYDGAVRWIRSIAAEEQAVLPTCNKYDDLSCEQSSCQNLAARLRRTDAYRRLKAMRRLSENLAVVDFLRQNMKHNNRRGHFEWPVWVGRIVVEGASEFTILQSTAKVVVTAPLQAPSHMPGSTLILNRTPTARFRCEPMNLTPVAPWGRITGLEKSDQQTLSSVGRLLEHANQVAVPTALIYHQRDPLDIRILTKRQARQRLDTAFWQRPTGSQWILDDNDEKQLICFWQDDSEEDPDNRSYITYMIDLMKTLKRLLQELPATADS